MKYLGRLRWVPAVVLSATAGVTLALWTHEGPLMDAGGEPVGEPSGEPQSSPPATAHAPGGGSGVERRAADTRGDRSPPRGDVTGLAPDDLDRLRKMLFARVGSDVEAALRELMALDPRQRLYLAEEVIRRAAGTAPDQTVAWLRNNVANEAELDRLLTAAYAGVAEQDPAFAMNAAESIEDPENRQLAQHQVLEAWSEQDVTAAYEWARAQTGEGSGEMYATVMQAYMEQSPEQAGDLVTSLPEGEERSRMINHYVQQLAASDPRAALDWLARFSGGMSDQEARFTIVDQWAEKSPWDAMAFAATEVDGEESYQLVGRIARQMGADQPRELAASLDRLPRDHQAMAAARLARSWAYAEPQAAREWVERLPDGEVQQAARQSLLQVAGQRRAERASRE